MPYVVSSSIEDRVSTSTIFLLIITIKTLVQNTCSNYIYKLLKSGGKKAKWLGTWGMIQRWVPQVVCLFLLPATYPGLGVRAVCNQKMSMPHLQSPKKSPSLELNDEEEYSSTGWYPFDHSHPTLGKCHERTHIFPPPHQVLQRLWDKALLTIPFLYQQSRGGTSSLPARHCRDYGEESCWLSTTCTNWIIKRWHSIPSQIESRKIGKGILKYVYEVLGMPPQAAHVWNQLVSTQKKL